MRNRGIGAGIVVSVVLLAGAVEAQADVDTFFVDTTSDAALTACTRAAGDCSLRGAFANADDGDAVTDTDSIIFDATIFDGVETVPNEKTVVMASRRLVTDENLESPGPQLADASVRRTSTGRREPSRSTSRTGSST